MDEYGLLQKSVEEIWLKSRLSVWRLLPISPFKYQITGNWVEAFGENCKELTCLCFGKLAGRCRKTHQRGEDMNSIDFGLAYPVQLFMPEIKTYQIQESFKNSVVSCSAVLLTEHIRIHPYTLCSKVLCNVVCVMQAHTDTFKHDFKTVRQSL